MMQPSPGVKEVTVCEIRISNGRACITHLAGSPVVDVSLSCAVPAGHVAVMGEMTRAQASEVRDALAEAIDTMPGELGES